jgi:hypothetical protein
MHFYKQNLHEFISMLSGFLNFYRLSSGVFNPANYAHEFTAYENPIIKMIIYLAAFASGC